MKVVLTGADGFLGWHTRVRLAALTDHDVVAVGRHQWPALDEAVRNADAIIHVAGVNRGEDHLVEQGNVQLARDVAQAVLRSGSRPRIIFANSAQSGNGSPYGTGKSEAAEILCRCAERSGSHFVEVLLPNLFGEHGRPDYNSFVANFAYALGHGEQPRVDDREIQLLHAQEAAGVLIGALSRPKAVVNPHGVSTTVASVFGTLRDFHRLYQSGDIPPLNSSLELDLFNVLRAASFPQNSPMALTPRVDDRGHLVEVVRAHGGAGQTFVSTTKPAFTRGEHFHLRKVERFVVLAGHARICLRKMFGTEVVQFDVQGDVPVAVDMPTMWAHNITNVGHTDLTTLFWTNDLFDADAPDTFPELVGGSA